MSTTAILATSLDMMNIYRGPMDTILDDASQAMQPEMYPDEKEESYAQLEIPWVDEGVGKQSNQEYNGWWVQSPRATDDNYLSCRNFILLSEPEVFMDADEQGKLLQWLVLSFST